MRRGVVGDRGGNQQTSRTLDARSLPNGSCAVGRRNAPGVEIGTLYLGTVCVGTVYVGTIAPDLVHDFR